MNIQLDAIRGCLEGVIPGTMATASADGMPNVAYLSQVQFVDSRHVAMSYQFFNKTRRNIMVNPRATLVVTHPATAMQYRLSIEYLRTETSGPLFESMKAKLAGIASQTGMSGVFRLLGADVFRVDDIQQVPGESMPMPPPQRNLLSALRNASERLSACVDLDRLLSATLACLQDQFGIGHTMILMLDQAGERLYTVASHGYEISGIGSEIPMGQGVIGVAAREGVPIRISHMTSEYAYSRAIRECAEDSGMAAALETEIPLPGLKSPRSQLAVPIVAGQRTLGVVYVESPQDLRFTYDDEDALVSLARQLGMSILHLQSAAECGDETAAPAAAAPPGPQGTPLPVRHFAGNDSVFLGDDYLIKGVAGSIFWNLLRDYAEKGRTEFSNRELRLDSRIRLPDVSDNLEARLLLLGKRLVERNAAMRIEKTGRGRFRLRVDRPISLLQE
ncbi:GAF domain-containing protein [Noviherbaspirillum sp. CPCC 100848]|uniref:GAF domain-containing protein n=1 Tax=Noviherbaspirillum album TaxID=3080276 RepID=A0ABU6J6U3_9BURK|nr:GAF domain-containing protein [Noviherbaspirillum sp. CPCC 100848]MEC4719336.1 GAF domain-containing protein [Noviherbaspirillum sp. CPCC 100848]